MEVKKLEVCVSGEDDVLVAEACNNFIMALRGHQIEGILNLLEEEQIFSLRKLLHYMDRRCKGKDGGL